MISRPSERCTRPDAAAEVEADLLPAFFDDQQRPHAAVAGVDPTARAAASRSRRTSPGSPRVGHVQPPAEDDHPAAWMSMTAEDGVSLVRPCSSAKPPSPKPRSSLPLRPYFATNVPLAAEPTTKVEPFGPGITLAIPFGLPAPSRFGSLTLIARDRVPAASSSARAIEEPDAAQQALPPTTVESRRAARCPPAGRRAGSCRSESRGARSPRRAARRRVSWETKNAGCVPNREQPATTTSPSCADRQVGHRRHAAEQHARLHRPAGPVRPGCGRTRRDCRRG